MSLRQGTRYCRFSQSSGEAYNGNSTPDRRQYDDKRGAKYYLVMNSHGLPPTTTVNNPWRFLLRSCFLSLSRRQAQAASMSPLFETTSAAGGSSSNPSEQATRYRPFLAIFLDSCCARATEVPTRT